MFKLIKNSSVASDKWKTLTLAEGEAPHNVRLPVGPVLVPLSVWRARRAELIHREYEHGWPLGVWLAAGESPEAIERDVEDFTVIAVEFDKSGDSEGYSAARLLRERYGYKGELRAVGDVPHDKLPHTRQAGFDAFSVRAGEIAGDVLSGLFGHNGHGEYVAP